ncbi:MAG: ROK family protein [Opitutia bacterium]|jgi:predicted NBD/HSP70 family sugar kinase
MLKILPQHVAAADPGLVPASLWTREYLRQARAVKGVGELTLCLTRPDGTASRFVTLVPPEGTLDAETWLHVERTVKFLLWSRGGAKVLLAGARAPEFARRLSACYSADGARAFDADFNVRLFETELRFEAVPRGALPPESTSHVALGRHLDGCRIGFDLGGSDRKCAAVIDGKVVHSEEVKWDPYFQSDPAYHLAGIRDSLRRAAAHLPKVDAIGGSSAGVYIGNKVRVASLFRGVTDRTVFERDVKDMFVRLAEEWKVPFEVLNDGDVTALAASMSLGRNAVLGVAMGTSVAAGYVDRSGNLTNWLSELAFVPVDYRADAPADEWSGDRGCAVQYFSQQAVGRLLPSAGIITPPGMRLPEQLEMLQERMQAGDDRAAKVYEAVGVAFGYAIAHFADFYDMEAVLSMGRVTTGSGGDLISEVARRLLATEFPELRVDMLAPDERDRRHGQAVAAASLAPTSRQ